jgi:ParB family chromosome partitioning protein
VRGAGRGARPHARGGRARVGRSRVAVSNLIRLLDLPDEAIELIEEGELSEGHGARCCWPRITASGAGWRARPPSRAGRCGARSARARQQRRGASPSPRRRPARPLHPDQEQAAQEIADALGAALGADVDVKPTAGGGYRAQLSFATPEEALELARGSASARWRRRSRGAERMTTARPPRSTLVPPLESAPAGD